MLGDYRNDTGTLSLGDTTEIIDKNLSLPIIPRAIWQQTGPEEIFRVI